MYLQRLDHTKLNIRMRDVKQITRPTGLLDPKIEVRPTENQIDDLLSEIQTRFSVMNAYLLQRSLKR